MKSLIYFLIGIVSSLAVLRHKADEGDPEALYRMALLYENGYDSITPDSTKAVGLLRKSATLGFAPAQNYLGYLFREGNVLKADPDSARFWIGRAADAGDPKAANNLAYMLLEDYSPKSDSIAATYLSRAAQAGLPVAMTTLGNLYAEGRGVAQDSAVAVSLFEMALSAGFRDAELYLLNLKGREWLAQSETDRLETAIHYMRIGSPLIATEIISGLDDFSSLPEADESIRQPGMLSIKQKARVFALLGYAFSHGAAVEYNHAKANKYFAAAALLGDPGAAFIFAESLEIFPGLISSSLFSLEELDALRKAGADLEITPDELRDFARSAGIVDARQARLALISESPPSIYSN